MQDAIKAAIATVIGVLLIASIMGAATNYVENVDDNTAWDSAIDTANSSDYLVENDSLYLQSSTAVVTTLEQNISDKSNVTFETTQASGATTVTVYDGNGTSLVSEALTDEETFSYDVPDNVDSYYVEYSSDQSADSEIDRYSTTFGDNEFAGYLRILLLAFIGAGLLLVFG